MEKMSCPCHSGKSYTACCGPYHTHAMPVPTPEALMRSRYSAYTQANIDWILETMKGAPLEGFDPVAARQWAGSVIWLGLEVRGSAMQDATHGTVEFVARFLQQESLVSLHEVSDFQLDDARWLYVGGKAGALNARKKVPRNAPCPCGSMRKFKNCHCAD